MHCGMFKFPEQIEEAFYNPRTINVMEAIISPRKRRVSIEGELTDISPIWTTGPMQRKILKLSSDGKLIEVKLWGQQVDIATPPVGQTVKVSCLTIGEYKGVKDANSTDLMEIQCDERISFSQEVVGEIAFDGIVEAASFDPQDYSILLESEKDEWRVDAENFLQVFPLEVFEENIKIRGHRCGRQILDVERIDG